MPTPRLLHARPVTHTRTQARKHTPFTHARRSAFCTPAVDCVVPPARTPAPPQPPAATRCLPRVPLLRPRSRRVATRHSNMRLTAEVLASAPSRLNPVGERELCLRGVYPRPHVHCTPSVCACPPRMMCVCVVRPPPCSCASLLPLCANALCVVPCLVLVCRCVVAGAGLKAPMIENFGVTMVRFPTAIS